jgi:Integrase core domain
VAAEPSPENPLHGSCLCGGVHFEVTAPFRWANHCHCSRCLDWLLILNRRHLERVLRVFVEHYNGHRPHRALNLMPPDPQRPRLRLATSSAPDHLGRRDLLGGLIHEYGFAA